MTEKVVRYDCWCITKDADVVEVVRYSDYEALAVRVEELNGVCEARGHKVVELVNENKRLREALECCADMLRRVDSGRATEAAIDFAMDAARAALQGPTE